MRRRHPPGRVVVSEVDSCGGGACCCCFKPTTGFGGRRRFRGTYEISEAGHLPPFQRAALARCSVQGQQHDPHSNVADQRDAEAQSCRVRRPTSSSMALPPQWRYLLNGRRGSMAGEAPGGPCWTSVLTPELISSGIAPFIPLSENYNGYSLRSRGLFGLCVVGGRGVAKLIRQEYLKDNNAFLLHCHSCVTWSSYDLAAKAKLLAWMEANQNWADRCGKEINYTSISINSSKDLTKLDLMDLQSGGIVYQGGASGAEGTPNLGDFFSGWEVSYALDGPLSFSQFSKSVKMLRETIDREIHPHHSVHLRFASDVNFIFNDPRVACLFDVKELLLKAMDGKSEDDDVCMDVCLRVEASGATESFKYLLTLPGTRRQARQILGRLLSPSNPMFSSSCKLLRSLLEENIFDVNEAGFRGRTALHELVRFGGFPSNHYMHRVNVDVRKIFYRDALLKMKMLLEFSANPHVADSHGSRPIDTLHSSILAADKEFPEFKEMAVLLEGGHIAA